MEPRRRRKEEARKQADVHSGGSSNPRTKMRRKRTRQSWDYIAFWAISAVLVLTTLLIVLIQRRGDPTDAVRSDSRSLLRSKLATILNHRQRKRRLEHRDVYDQAYRLAKDVNPLILPFNEKPYHLTAEYGPGVKCSITALFMDPRLSTLPTGQPAWFALESVATFAPNACILIQTSKCMVEAQSTDQIDDVVANNIYSRSLPRLRGMMEQGRVRVTYPDTKKYKLTSCNDFGNLNMAFMNRNFWNDEFIESIDSETVLVIQDDAVLCRPLELERWQIYAHVGAVWPKEPNILFPNPPEGMCVGMPIRWNSWLFHQRRWEKQQVQLQHDPDSVSLEDQVAPPSRLLNTMFPSVCGQGNAPVGNGGLSIRNRTWLVEAIEACPHVNRAGFEVNDTIGCQVVDLINEDFYFATVLRGMGAPMPTAHEASMFATEMLLPEHVQRLYGDGAPSSQETAEQIIFDGQFLTIPGAFHKPWWYLPNALLRSPGMEDSCPFLGYLFQPEQSRWHEFEKEEHSWGSVGS